MNSEHDFITAIRSNPTDELLLQVFGDWLEEQGDPRADWVRSPHVRVWMGETFSTPIPPILAALGVKMHVREVRRAMPDLGAVIVPDLIALLQNDDSVVRLHAVWCLRKIGPPAVDAIPALMEAMKDVSPDVREQAANAIQDIRKKPRSVGPPPLQQETKSPSESVRAPEKSDPVREQLLHWLESEDVNERVMAVGRIAQLQQTAAVAPLCGALADKEVLVREAAAYHLIFLACRDSEESIGPLRAALSDSSPRVRGFAITALGMLGKTARTIVPDLLRLLEDDESDVRASTARALGAIAAGDDVVLQALHRAAQDEELEVARAAVESMSRWPSLPPESGEVLLALIERVEGWRATVALTALGKLDRPTPAVLALLRERVGDAGAALALRQFGQHAADAIPDLLAATHTGNVTSAITLARLGEAGVSALVELLDDPSETTRDTAVAGLGCANETAIGALPHLLKIIRNPDHSQRWFAVRAIGAIGPAAAKAAPDLIAILSDNQRWGCGDEAFKTLRIFGEALVPHIPALAAQMKNPEASVRAVRLLAELAPHSADVLNPLREALQIKTKDNPRAAEIRRYAIEGLGQLGDTAVAPDILPFLNDGDDTVRRESAVALGRTRSTAAVSRLNTALRDADESVRARAAEALGLIGEGAPDLCRALRDGSPRVRREAATALGRMKSSEEATRIALRAAEEDSDSGVSRAARSARKKIESNRKG